MLESHYAPQTPVIIVATDQLERVLAQLQHAHKKVALLHYGPLSTTVLAPICLSHQPAQYAHELYASLRLLDRENADVIVVQDPPESTAWHGIHDRLRRAAHDSLGVLARLLSS
jgi:L-threonylcarbamoyladenylate synthase